MFLVGFLTTDKKFAELIGTVAFAHGIDFYYFSKKDIDTKGKEIIYGHAWNRERACFERQERKYPDIIDFSTEGWSNELRKNFKPKSLFVFGTTLKNKAKSNEIIKNSEYSRFSIATHFYNDINIDELLQKYDAVMIKSNTGMKGESAHKLTKNDDKYVLCSGSLSKELNDSEYLEYATLFASQKYIVQPFHSFTTKSGNPFDIRVVVHRGKNGVFTYIQTFIRVGSKQGIVSNISRGGYGVTRKWESFIETEITPTNKQHILSELAVIKKHLPQILQNGYSGHISCIAFDIGYDRNTNEVKIIEVNAMPLITKSLQPDMASVKIEHWKYLFKNHEKFFAIQNKKK